MTTSKQSSRKKTTMPVFALSQIAAAVVLLAPSFAQAHGSLELPLSRERVCRAQLGWNSSLNAEAPKDEACIAAYRESGNMQFYDWTANVQGGHIPDQQAHIPNGLLCAGGKPERAGLDVPGNWKTTQIAPDASGNFTVQYLQTAAHFTNYFRTYLTKDSYKFDRPIHWEDLELVGDSGWLDRPQNNAITPLEIKIPKGMTGKRVMYNVWQRDPSDNAETFYACADVVIAGDVSPWQPSQALQFYELPENSKLALRVMDSAGKTAESHEITIAAGQTSGSAIALAMAKKVNTASHLVQIGTMDDQGNISPAADAQANQLFVKDKAYTAILEVKATQIESSSNSSDNNRAPVALIEAPANANAGQSVTLDASSSTDEDQDRLTYVWKIPAGVTVNNSLQQATINFTAPHLAADTSFTFEVTVSDGKASTIAKHTVIVSKESGIDSNTDTNVDEENNVDNDNGNYPAYKAGTAYQAGDIVQNAGGVYQCKPWPYTAWCGGAKSYYAPGTGSAWAEAWNKVSK